VLVILGGMLAIVLIVGNRVDKSVADRADRIERQFNDIRRDIDRRLPVAGAVPSVTPLPTASPAPTPTPTPSPSPSASPTATPSATRTPSSGGGNP
jgi:hypothetical protein